MANRHLLFNAHRSIAGQRLPEYYFVYFLFADLLGFHNLGKDEKVAWTFPIDYNGKAFLIEYRKFGIGVFVQDKEKDETAAEEITNKIIKAVKSITAYYNHIAEVAVNNSEINIINYNSSLYKRFTYLMSLYKREKKKYEKNRNSVKVTKKSTKYGNMTIYKNLSNSYFERYNWLAISCIDSFFSWTEHLFIHLSIIANNISNGRDVANLIGAEWKVKYQKAIVDNSVEAKKYYNDLLKIRQQIRNYISHGAFGKDGNSFEFHSPTGAIPVIMNYNMRRNRFSLNGTLLFNENEVIQLIEDFIKYLWKSNLKTSMFYTQKLGLPTILTYASNGTYKNAIANMKNMKKLCDYLLYKIETSANMDW